MHCGYWQKWPDPSEFAMATWLSLAKANPLAYRSAAGVLLSWLLVVNTIPSRAANLDLATFFTGHLRASGQFNYFNSGTARGVKVDIRGGPSGGVFKITMNTTFSDGQREVKVWTFRKTGDGRYLGRRADLIGTAAVVVQDHSVSLNYVAKVKNRTGKTYNVAFAETYQFTSQGKGTSTVRASVLSIPVGEGHLIIRKLSK